MVGIGSTVTVTSTGTCPIICMTGTGSTCTVIRMGTCAIICRRVQIVIQPFPSLVGGGMFPESLMAAANVKAGYAFAFVSLVRVDGLVERKLGAMSEERCHDERCQW